MSKLHLTLFIFAGLISFGICIPFIFVGTWSDTQKIALDIGEQITYKDEGNADYWKTAEEVIADGGVGDCEDIAAYAATTIKDLYPEADVMMINMKGHMVFQVNGSIIDTAALIPITPASWSKDKIIDRWDIKFYNERVIPTHNIKGWNLPSMF